MQRKSAEYEKRAVCSHHRLPVPFLLTPTFYLHGIFTGKHEP